MKRFRVLVGCGAVAFGALVAMPGAALALSVDFVTPVDTHVSLPTVSEDPNVTRANRKDFNPGAWLLSGSGTMWHSLTRSGGDASNPDYDVLAVRQRSQDVDRNALDVGKAQVTFTFLNSEAGFTDTFVGPGGEVLFDGQQTAPGTEVTTTWNGGLLDFSFCTDGRNAKTGTQRHEGGCIGNGDAAIATGPNLDFGISKLFEHDGKLTMLFFFGDGVGDGDLDDMIVAATFSAIPQVPLPAGVVLLGSALAGAALFKVRRRRT